MDCTPFAIFLYRIYLSETSKIRLHFFWCYYFLCWGWLRCPCLLNTKKNTLSFFWGGRVACSTAVEHGGWWCLIRPGWWQKDGIHCLAQMDRFWTNSMGKFLAPSVDQIPPPCFFLISGEGGKTVYKNGSLSVEKEIFWSNYTRPETNMAPENG